ncbi:MAG: phosphoglucosamine mutase [Bdellovibrionaceae bacterium]|nr:phosphoglucosamine mutase [Pseudobdellovibrionaceae bacterium]
MESPVKFGTDGIRGLANQFPITTDVALKVGQALGVLVKKELHKKGSGHMVLIGKDTRISGYMIEQALASGLNSMGVSVQLVGPLPTPGVGFLTKNMRCDAGVVISASHNLYMDNGIKLFGADGFKVSKETEASIEQLLLKDLSQYLVSPQDIGRTRRIEDASGRYVVHVKNVFPHPLHLEGLRIVVDSAHGAAYKVAPAIFEELGAKIINIGNHPNGFNINKNFGALCPSTLQKAVIEHKADLGIAVDGDADRILMVDELGQILSGDHILGLCAMDLKKQKALNNDAVVLTPMSSIALINYLKKENIQVHIAPVGDKNVVALMKEKDCVLGGENSGHVIFLDHSTTGDACIAALKILELMKIEKKKLSQMRNIFKTPLQINHSVKLSKIMDSSLVLSDIPKYSDTLKQLEDNLGGNARIYVRPSGTEPVVRIFLEGEDKALLDKSLTTMTEFLEKNIN